MDESSYHPKDIYQLSFLRAGSVQVLVQECCVGVFNVAHASLSGKRMALWQLLVGSIRASVEKLTTIFWDEIFYLEKRLEEILERSIVL
jgi:hypothetical protein